MNKILAVIGFAALLFLSACTTAATANPTVDVGPIETMAVQTIVAEITETAIAEETQNAPSPTPEVPTETPTPEVTNTPAPCADAAWVRDVTIADGTTMQPGETFVKTWAVKNTGSCTWRDSFYLIFGYGDKMGGTEVALSSDVEPGQETNLSITLTAPQKAGNYFGWWRLKNEWGVPFGEFFGVTITVP